MTTEVRNETVDLDAVEERFLAELLPILQCTVCDHPQLNVTDQKRLRCDACRAEFELTEDFIPIMFPPEDEPVRNANIAVYDAISSSYLERKVRSPPGRLSAVFDRIQKTTALTGRRHLDFGCGPGFVIHWLRDYQMNSVGLDVSLNNLRNTRMLTGALVVCGDASRMPFQDGIFHLVTESAVVHHVADWQQSVRETGRITDSSAVVLLDSEPGVRQMNISKLAQFVYWLRKPVYGLLSTVFSKKWGIHNQHGQLSDVAEVHNQPGTGISSEEVGSILQEAGFETETVYSPNSKFESGVEKMTLARLVLNLLSFRNPWDPRNGTFSVVAFRRISDQS